MRPQILTEKRGLGLRRSISPDIGSLLSILLVAKLEKLPHRRGCGAVGAGLRPFRFGGEMNSEDTLTRAEIAERLNRQIGLSRAESAQLVEQVLDLVAEALEQGENVKISGFGTFVLRDKNERVGRNPKTGIEVPITPRRVLTFRPSQSLRDRVAGA
jgi:integration host factor subunit alpha